MAGNLKNKSHNKGLKKSTRKTHTLYFTTKGKFTSKAIWTRLKSRGLKPRSKRISLVKPRKRKEEKSYIQNVETRIQNYDFFQQSDKGKITKSKTIPFGTYRHHKGKMLFLHSKDEQKKYRTMRVWFGTENEDGERILNNLEYTRAKKKNPVAIKAWANVIKDKSKILDAMDSYKLGTEDLTGNEFKEVSLDDIEYVTFE